jgi:4-aminobutyrate aminotransferase-like enzyme
VYRVPAPYPYRGVTSDDAIAAIEHLFKADVDPETVACVVLEPVQGEGGFIVMPPDYPARLQEVCRRHGILYVDDEIQSGVGRTGTMWAIEQYDGVEPDLLVSGKSIGGGLPLAGVTGRAEVMDAVPAGGLGGTFAGNPLSCEAANVVLDIVADEDFLSRSRELGTTMRARLEQIARGRPEVGEVRGLGPMLALELAERAPERAKAVVAAAFERRLVLLSCGLYGNVIRLLPPLTISDMEVDEGLAILEESLAAAGDSNRRSLHIPDKAVRRKSW